MTSTVVSHPLSANNVDRPITMTGGQAMVEALKQYGVDTIFGLPGVQLDGLFSALYDASADIRVIHTRHEQATAYMADGYARVSGREGVCLVVPGPGLMNAAAGLATAYACNSPVLCLTGQIRSDLIGIGRGMLHEVPFQLEMARSFTKHAARASSPEEIPSSVHEAFRQLRTGRARPVSIEVPPDIFFAEGNVTVGSHEETRRSEPADPDAISAAADMLAKSKNPMIFGGGGLNRSLCGDSLMALAELLQAPILLSSNGKGGVSDREDLVVGMLADGELRPSADVILAVGTRFVSMASEARPLVPGQKLIRIDIDPEEIDRNGSPDVGIAGDADQVLRSLHDSLSRRITKHASRREEMRTLKLAMQDKANSVLPQAAFGMAIRNALPDEGIVVSEMTQLGYWSNLGFPVYQPNTFLTPGYQGTLGYGFTTALGAKVAKPEVPVVSVNGDGGFGFTLNELATMAQHNIGVVALVFNDSAYGNVRRIQQEDLNGKLIASDLINPDYLKLADAFGVAGRRVETPEKLQTALAEAIASDQPTLIEIPVGQMPNPWKALRLR
ncbi:thiamine pyrophosphate-binding protein [soil metagenome]